jgi:ubiquitin carboxyl-terminal hydrolase 7
MRPFSYLFALLPLLTTLISATALTYKLAANEKACFYTDVQRQNAKVAFYFAVRHPPSNKPP